MDNRMNTINIQDIDLLAIPSDFNPFKKFADGGEVSSRLSNNFLIVKIKGKTYKTWFPNWLSINKNFLEKLNKENKSVLIVEEENGNSKQFEVPNRDLMDIWLNDKSDKKTRDVLIQKAIEYNNNSFADGGELLDYSDNQLMVMNQNVEVEHNHEELEDILEDEMPVPAWVVAKMATATQSISDVTHYLDGQKELMEDENEIRSSEFFPVDEENEEEDEDQDEIENKIVVEPIDVSAGTKTDLTKNFTDEAWGNLRGFLKGMEGVDLRDDYTFDYKDEQYEVEPIINSDENGVSNAVFTIFDGDGEEVGEVAYSREGGKQKFTANSEFFSWNNAKFEDGGFMNNVYAKGGEVASEKSIKDLLKKNNFDLSKFTFKDAKNGNIDIKIDGKPIAYFLKGTKIDDDFSNTLISIIEEEYISNHKQRGLVYPTVAQETYRKSFYRTNEQEQEGNKMEKERKEKQKKAILSEIKLEDGGYFDGTIPKASSYMSNYANGGGIEWDKDSDSIRAEIGEFKIMITPQTQRGYYDVNVRANNKTIGNEYDVYGIGNAKNKAYEIISESNKFAKGGTTDRVPISAKLSKAEISNFVSYVHSVYEEQGFTERQVKIAVNKYLTDLGKQYTYGWGDSLDRERVYQYLLDPKLSEIKNPRFADGGFMSDVYAKGGSVKKDWWQTVVNPDEDFHNYDNRKPIDWEVDDFKEWVVSNSDLDGNVDKEVLDVIKMPKSKLTVEYLNKNGSGKNNNEYYKEFGNWQSALYDIFTQIKKDYLFKKERKYILKADIKTVTVKRKGKEVTYNGSEVLNGAYVLAKGGDITSKANYVGKNDIVEVELKDGSKVKPANGYWIKKGAEPISSKQEFTSKDLPKDGSPIRITAPAISGAPAIDLTLLYDSKNFIFDVYKDGRKKDKIGEKEVLNNLNSGIYVFTDKLTPTASGKYNAVAFDGKKQMANLSDNEYSDKIESFIKDNEKKGFEVIVDLMNKGKVEQQVYKTSFNKSNETKFSETVTKKGILGWDATTNVNDFNNYDWRITTFRGSSGKLISSAKGGKYEKGNGYTTFKYTMYDDPYHTLEVSQPSRLTEKVVTEQHEKALAKFKKFMETGTFGRGGKISNFDKLSAKVAKEYEGKPVKSQYQEEYGKYYSKEEAQEVGDKVAGKMKAMTADKKAFGGLFGGAKSLVSSKKYPQLEGKQVMLKSGKMVNVFEQSGDTLSVLELGKFDSGERPYSINISEVDMTSFKLGGETKKGRSGSQMLKQANILAKEIRKDGESWNDAKKRAFAQLKK